MPVTIQLKFPSGRYHATPWGRHVNEGVPEWPPSPWRLLRALIAVWKRTCPEITEQEIEPILKAIIQPPQFWLPRHRVAHTRHYMPWEKKGPQDRTMVFDTFVSVGRDEPLYLGWPDATLSADQIAFLSKLLDNLSSFGRAEGWVQANLSEQPPEWNCFPSTIEDANPIPVFCADPQQAFGNEHYPKLDSKKLAKGKINPAEFLFDCPRWHLCLDTETIHENRWPTVPGSKWVNYTRPMEKIAAEPKRTTSTRVRPTVARFMLDAPVLPLTTHTVLLAEIVRISVMSQFSRWCSRNAIKGQEFRRIDQPEKFSSRTLSGRELTSEMRKDHDHAFYLPTVEGEDPRRITHVIVYAPEGFGEGEVAAFTGLRTLPWNEEREGLQVQLVGLGKPEEFKHRLFEKCSDWVSVTPFVVHRHLKKRGQRRDTPHLQGDNWRKDFARLALEELLVRLGYPSALVTLTEPEAGHPRPQDFRRKRDRIQDDGLHRPFGWLRIQFSEPVMGPLALGHNAHFGLGQFVPRQANR